MYQDVSHCYKRDTENNRLAREVHYIIVPPANETGGARVGGMSHVTGGSIQGPQIRRKIQRPDKARPQDALGVFDGSRDFWVDTSLVSI